MKGYLAIFKIQHLQVFENLDTDANITEATRRDLLEQLLTAVAHDSVVVKNRVVSFCQAHQSKGPKQPTAQKADLGHVEERSKTEATLAGVGIATSGFTRHGLTPAAFFDSILLLDLTGQRDLLDGIWLSEYEMWSFYQSRTLADPFHGLSRRAQELVRRLGLGRSDPSHELLLWAHRLRPEQNARVPTAFDAALYDYYRPGGKTKPLSGDDGLREVVHPPITGDQLAHRIERASSP